MKKITLCILIIVLIIGCSSTKKENNFSKEYNIKEDNPFIEVTTKEALSTLKGSGIIIFAFSDCPYCQLVMPVLSDVGLEHGITDIKYYDVKKVREENTKDYQEMVAILKEYLPLDDNNNPRIYVPHIFFIKDGIVLNQHANVIPGRGNNKSKLSKQEYQELFTILEKYLLEYMENSYCAIEEKEGC